MDAISMFVMSVQEVYLNNAKIKPENNNQKKDDEDDDIMTKLGGRTITVIHLCNLD
jgi:hypothetical protein